jgi:uncharacterized protein (DUF3084 family)
MESEDSLHQEESERQTTVIQNISTLDLTLDSQLEESQNFIFPQSTEPIIDKLTQIRSQNHSNNEVKLPEFPESNLNIYQNELTERNLKIISVEIDFLKQSACYLQSQLSTKSLEIQTKDEKIQKLEKIIEKQKQKLKDLKSRVKFQEGKLGKLESRLPAYQDLVEKYKAQQVSQVELDEKFNKLEGAVSKFEIKKNKFTSSSPRMKNPASPYRVCSPRSKKFS